MSFNRSLPTACIVTLALLSAVCGANEVRERDRNARGTSRAASGSLEPCKLLTDAQVRTVLPDLADSSDMSTGNSLVKTIQSYQCSHVSTNGAGLLIVIVNIASTQDSFESLKGSSEPPDGARKVDIGDAAWVFPDEAKLEVVVLKGRAVIHLDTKDATQKSRELVELARIVAGKVG